MPFLDAHLPEHQVLLSRHAEHRELSRGDYLIRRGEAPGDVYELASGVLEVVDSTRVPEMVLNRLAPGAVVGELAFVEQAPRLVDVRAGTDCVLRAWSATVLEDLFAQHPAVAATFHREVARVTARRLRRLTDRAIAGTFAGPDAVDSDDDAATWVQRIIEGMKEVMPDLEAQARGNPEDPLVRAELFRTFDQLEAAVRELFEAVPDAAGAGTAEAALRRDLHPYLVRSSLAERALRRSSGRLGTVQILAQAMIDRPLGDGAIGALVDEWMLARPTFAALRALHPELVRTVRRGLPDDRTSRLTVLNVGTGSLFAALDHALQDHQESIVLTVVDESPRALQLLPLPAVAPRVDAVTLQTDLVAFATGQRDLELPPQDIVVLHHLVEVLPERIAVALLGQCRRQLADDGALVVSTLGPSNDRVFVGRVLGWPTIRRTALALDELMRAAGFRQVTPVPVRAPGQLLVAFVAA